MTDAQRRARVGYARDIDDALEYQPSPEELPVRQRDDVDAETMTNTQSYTDFLTSKRLSIQLSGFEVSPNVLNPGLFAFQRDICIWALRLGRAAIFLECGMGKTFIQLEWAKHVVAHTGGKVLILAPLAVGQQTVREGVKFNVPVVYCHDQSEVAANSIVVTNYERLDKFEAAAFSGIILDESSILKSFSGKTKRSLIKAFEHTPYKLACTATPAPNDHMELGNHAEFLDVLTSHEMLSRWFINDTMQAGNYRLKRHAEADFWRWLTSWAVCLSKPSDLGAEYHIPDFDLPRLDIQEHLVATSSATLLRVQSEGRLLPDGHPSSTQIHKVKRESLPERIAEAVAIVAALDDQESVIFWCDTNDEADALKLAFPQALEVRGSHSADLKEQRLLAFSVGDARMIITKPDIAGFGLNWQHCAEQVFIGVSYSFEKFYQSIRRSWRFGQTRPVRAHLIYAFAEGDVLLTLREKQQAFAEMQAAMNSSMREHGLFRNDERRGLTMAGFEQAHENDWTLYLGDAVTVTAQLPDNSIDFGIHSPPFANLYIYSDAEADMGNSADNAEFFKHYDFLIQDLYRTTRPGRLCAIHCKDLPLYINRDDAAGLYDFPSDIRAHFERAGWVYHSRVTIWKDPVIEMQRTKNHGLLHKNFAERSEACRQGMPDYLLVFRKWPIEGGASIQQHRVIGDYIGTEPPLEYELHPNKRTREENYSIAVWQRYASPVWFDIDQTNVLNYQQARSSEDERHICPLQLDVIARAIDLWSAPGETVFSPFAGIGSEGYQAILQGRKFIGVELKREYFEIACRYLRDAQEKVGRPDLFSYALSINQAI